MKKLLYFSAFCLLINETYATTPVANPVKLQTETPFSSIEKEAQTVFHYFLNEVELDVQLTHEEQNVKVIEFKQLATHLSPEVAFHATNLLLEETRLRVMDMLKNSALDQSEFDANLASYDEAILNVNQMTVEIAREMLFFVAELKIHRQLVHDFGVALGCPEKQLLRHDLCKLSNGQFEGYARYFRGGRLKEDLPAFRAAWELHQYEEHHHQAYRKEGFNFDNYSEERLRNNMRETAADYLAASKQRGGISLINYLVNVFPKQNPHPRLIPHLEEALKRAHELHLYSEANPDSEYKIFQGLPCWNDAVQAAFNSLK